jgi:hypothetical protein
MDGELDLVAFADVQGAPNLFRQGDLGLRSHLHPSPEPGLGLPAGYASHTW